MSGVNVGSSANRLTRALLICAALCTAGCFRSHAYSGLPPGKPAASVDEKWHHAVLWGVVELSGPYSLARLCPNGWAELHTKTGVAHTALGVISVGLYAPQSVTVICAAEMKAGRPAAPPKAGYDRQRHARPASTKPKASPAPSIAPSYPAAAPEPAALPE